jgi:methionyl-tRNA formyltransferase
VNIVFAGTPEFARQSLQALVETGMAPRVVLTQPDRAAGRGKKLKASAVKQYAADNDLPVWQPPTLKDASVTAELKALQPDVMVVAAYGLLLPQAVLDIPTAGCVNVHASLLPRWRGAAPVQGAILAGDRKTGISLMQMDAGLDSGPVYAREAFTIGDQETAGQLEQRLALLGGNLLVARLQQIADGEAQTEVQDETQATYAGKISNQDAEIDWSESAQALQRKIRAYNARPGAWFHCNGERVKCWKAAIAHGPAARPGEVVKANKHGVQVACGDGVLQLDQLQRPGRKPVSGSEFAAQQLIAEGQNLACLP